MSDVGGGTAKIGRNMEQEVIGKIDDVPTSIHEGITSEFYEQIELVHSKGLIELAPIASLSLVFRRN